MRSSLSSSIASYLTRSSRIINLPASSFTTLSPPLPSNPPVICASQAPQIIDIENANEAQSFPAMRNPIHTVLSSSTESVAKGLFLASDSDRYINVFDPQSQRLVMNLVAENEVSSLSLYAGPEEKTNAAALLEKQVLAAVTDDGAVEFFARPFFQPGNQPGSKGTASLKAKSKQMTRRADAALKITRSETSDALVPVVKAAFQGSDLVIAWAEGGVIPVFERVKLLSEDTDELLFTGTKKVPKTKSSAAFGGVTTNGTKNASETQVDESNAVVEQGNYAEDDVEMQDSRQDAASVSGSEDSGDDQEPNQANEQGEPQKEVDGDVEMENASGSEKEEEEEQGGEPSFGELMRANAPEEVDVEAELEDDTRMGSLVPGKPNAAVQQIPTGVSLSTVLTQSLKTNDSAMLESCFHTSDLSIIRTTIQRLDSSLAATLLQRLAERLSSRPSRYGHLLVWVQWTCVAHGGALAGKPDLLKRMNTLFKVMDQRSSSLPSLLQLKGKLDMLDAQLGLRQSLRSGADGLDSEDEDNVIYVEGQEADEADDSDADADPSKNEATPRSKAIRDHAFDEDESMMNGVQGSDNDEDSSADEDEDAEQDNENENIFDVEAEESAGSSDAEESLDENEADDDEEDNDSAGSMVDFIADSEAEDDESDAGAATAPQPPPSKKPRRQSGDKGKSKTGSAKK